MPSIYRIWLLLLSLHCIPCSFMAQLPVERCGADQFLQDGIVDRPELKDQIIKNRRELNEFRFAPSAITRSTPINIPVVFHVVYRNDEQNITDYQIYDQLAILNRSFNRSNHNLHWVDDEFRHLIADIEIEFCLARTDPNGVPTSGINRIKTEVEEIGRKRFEGNKLAIFFADRGGVDLWDPNHYLNIWICEIGGNIAGSATFPNLAPYPEAEGILMDYRYIGSVGSAIQSSPYDGGKTLVHEMGHYFNLFHPWGPGVGGCDTDDEVEDTPLQEGPYFSCQPTSRFSCGSTDIVTNFMDYAEDACLAMFTAGQKERMLASLQLFRPDLLESEACKERNPHETEIDLKEIDITYDEPGTSVVIMTSSNERIPVQLSLIDLSGRLVAEKKVILSYSYRLNTERLAAGMYILCLRNKSQRICEKVIVY